jgi:cellulose synthase/poly-beta-1,6-N-acetylglucosamine synthase-like glycosyltransferase
MAWRVRPARVALVPRPWLRDDPDVLPSLSIVIPAYHEAESIEASVSDALEVGAAHAAALGGIARDPRVVVLRRAVNRGIEASIRALYAIGSPAPRLPIPDVKR